MDRISKYEYVGRCKKVVDGDTYDIVVVAKFDMGFNIIIAGEGDVRFRLDLWDTEELRGGTEETKARARAAKAFCQKVLIDDQVEREPMPLRIFSTGKDGAFGRWIARVHYRDEDDQWKDLGEALVAAGLADPYEG